MRRASFPRGAETEADPEFEERVVYVNRCSKVVKGGRRFSFSAVVVVGNGEGKVGYGFGKANEATDAIRKGGELARKALVTVKMRDKTIPHEVTGRHSGSIVLLKPASPGTGVIAGGGARAVLDLAGVRDVLAKSLGSGNKLNVVKATFSALEQLRTVEEAEVVRKGAKQA
ncbi:MAG: 30S ribosomal protein S5 [Kiritimatiellae bacterium]|nr:30S ribosomal protein S5 [Kiritimatiellia bacterium]